MGVIANRRILRSSSSPPDGLDCLYDGVACNGASSHRPAPSHDLLVAAGCLIAAAFFLALTFYILCSHYNRRREHDALIRSSGNTGQLAARQPKTTGLDEDTIAAIAVIEYNAEDGLLGATECSVCLSDFEDGELIRLLPKCCHAFHVSCIDAWLCSHVNCPLCRAPIVSPAPPADPITPPQPSLPITTSDPPEGGREEAAIDPSTSSSSNLPQLPRLATVRRSASMVVIPVVGGGSNQNAEDAGESSAGRERDNVRINQNAANKEVGTFLMGSTGRRFFFYKHRRSKSLVLPM